MNAQLVSHWNNIYSKKTENEMSWTQEKPETSLQFISSFNLDKKAKIIDIGGGESHLVDFLLDQGYENITVLDISEEALEKSKKRLGEKAKKVNWIVSDILDFMPGETYDVWHDRATFHFITKKNDLKKYIDILAKSSAKYLVIGTFSYNGPEKCSGLPIRQYSEESLTKLIGKYFKKLKCIYDDHVTPLKKIQNFLFCSMIRIS